MRGTLRDLWQECFGDSNDYVDFYFQNHEITKHTMVYLDDGQPVGLGTHDMLLENCPVYQEIYASQFETARKGGESACVQP